VLSRQTVPCTSHGNETYRSSQQSIMQLQTTKQGGMLQKEKALLTRQLQGFAQLQRGLTLVSNVALRRALLHKCMALPSHPQSRTEGACAEWFELAERWSQLECGALCVYRLQGLLDRN
jgi:hypothetical protein